MDLFGHWIATKNGMLGTLLAMIESGEIAHAQTQAELLAAIDDILNAGLHPEPLISASGMLPIGSQVIRRA